MESAPLLAASKPKTPEPEPVEVKEPHINFNNYLKKNFKIIAISLAICNCLNSVRF